MNVVIWSRLDFNFDFREKPTFNHFIEICQWEKINDQICDDELNNPLCFYDGGDCCNTNASKSFCYECSCHLDCEDYENVGIGICNVDLQACDFQPENWLGDGFCDDDANHENCNYDSGDCCDGDHSFCLLCECIVPKGIRIFH